MIIVLNQKSNLTKDEYLKYQKELLNIKTQHNLILCPSSCYLSYNRPDNISLGSQDCSRFESGAHTGEISATQLKSLDIKYCLVGHSERRIEKKESIEDINMKIKQLLSNDIIPVLCIGETQEEKNNNLTKDVIKYNIEQALINIEEKDQNKIIVAYEPIWAIGTDKTPLAKELTEIFGYIKEICPNNKLLYGGSVNEQSIPILNKVKKVDGYLLGRISLEVDKVKKIIEKI